MIVYAKVKEMREAGLQAKWGRSGNAPALFVRDPNGLSNLQRDKWWIFNKQMQSFMSSEGIINGFNLCTILGDIFYIKVN